MEKKQQQDNTHTNVKEANKQKSSLIDYKEVEGTPFTIVSKEREESEERDNFIMFGKYRISESYETVKEAIEKAKVLDWFKIMGVIHAIAETIVDVKLKNKK